MALPIVGSILASKSLPLILGGLQIGGGLAHNFLAGRDENKFRKKFAKQQGRANLVSALTRGRVNPTPTAQPKQGFLTKATGALSQGAGAANQILDLGRGVSNLIDDRKMAKRIQEQQLKRGAIDIAQSNFNLGTDLGPFAQPPSSGLGGGSVAQPPQLSRPQNVASPGVGVGGGLGVDFSDRMRSKAPPPSRGLQLPSMPDPLQAGMAAGRQFAGRQEAERQQQNELFALRTEIARQDLSVQLRQQTMRDEQNERDKQIFEQNKQLFDLKLANQISQEQERSDMLKATVAAEQAKVEATFVKDHGAYMDLHQRNIRALPGFGTQGLPVIQRMFTTGTDIFGRIDKDGQLAGADAIALLNVFQRFIDPATVREGDIKLLQSAQSVGNQIEAIRGRLEAGELLSSTLVAQMKEGLIGMYGARLEALNSTLTNYESEFTRGNTFYGVKNFDNISGLRSAFDDLKLWAP